MSPATDKKKVLFVITKAGWGGAQRYVYDLATGLPEDSFETSVAFGRPGKLARALAETGVRTHLVKTLQRDVSLSGDVRSFIALFRLFRSERPSVVHLNSSKAGGVGALAARLAGVPRVVFTAHGWPFLERRGRAWRAFAWAGSWATALLSNAVIVISRNDLAIGERLPFCRGKMRLVYNGRDLPPLGSGEVIRAAFQKGARITGTIGELTPNKNQIALIEAAKADPKLFVAIVGEGELRTKLEQKITEYGLTDRVKLFGFLPAEEALAGFDAFSLPSLKEGLPYVLIEARMAGLPVVLTNRVGGVGEILDAPDMSAFTLSRMVSETIKLYQMWDIARPTSV